MTTTQYLFIKIFDKEEYADSFIQRGELFCRTLGYFKRMEGDQTRGDTYEGVIGWHQPDKISLMISYLDDEGMDRVIPIEELAGPVIVQSHGYDQLNVYCMYTVNIPIFEETYETEEERVKAVEKINTMLKHVVNLSEKILAFGEFSVVVHKVGDFVGRVRKAASEKNYSCWHNEVKYYDPESFSGSFSEIESIFRKRNLYEDQSEYRFVFGSHEPEGAKMLHLGSLEDIAIKVRTSEINEKIQLRLDESTAD